jgi:hypothetical protein
LWPKPLFVPEEMVRVHGGNPMSVADPLPYTSPLKKLVRFFQRSRDKWKKKCQTAKRENNSLKIRLAAMKESRDRWRAKAKELAVGPVEMDVVPQVRVTKKAR